MNMAGEGRYCRSLNDVHTVIRHAKLSDNDLLPLTQVLSFASRNNFKERYKFLELNSTLLAALQEGQSLIFRGNKDDNAVLCTHGQTYEVKEAETSNSLLLLPDLKWPVQAADVSNERYLEGKQVLSVFHKYYELRACKPRLRRLHQLLEKCLYQGPEYEEDLKNSGVKLYTFEDLLENVQASELELKKELEENFACVINGAWRFLEHEYHFRVLSYILNFVDENSWPVDKLNKTETLQSLAALVPVEVLDQCFSWYTEKTGTFEDGDPHYRLIESRVCRFLAEVLLRQAGKFNLRDFFSSWQQSVPEGMQTSEKYLEGLALMDKKSKPEVIWYFPETDLPEDVNERIRILFETREKWTLDEIRPYIQRLATEKMNVNALLTKYARASSVGGVRYYGAKHAK